jgi:hypothetical protein
MASAPAMQRALQDLRIGSMVPLSAGRRHHATRSWAGPAAHGGAQEQKGLVTAATNVLLDRDFQLLG